jgi:OTU-like cysteine protease
MRGKGVALFTEGAPNPGQGQRATIRIISYYFPPSHHMGPPRSHRRAQKAVLPCMFYAFRASLVMVTDGVNVLSVRSRTTRSSKGKASQTSSPFLPFPDLFFLTFSLYSPPPHVLFLSSIFFQHSQLLSDPEANTQQLTEQLRHLGLYAADTTGDGNCLFRALSDQLHGTESRHLQLRKDICDWIQSHSVRYAPFVDDERGLDVHLSLMRQPGTHTLPPTLFYY